MASCRRTAKRPHRRPKSGGYARGDKVRTRILFAAAEIFAQEGYKAASTRGIATAAGVNAPALQYYFGGKAGLHAACGRLCCEWFEDGLRAELARAKLVADARSSSDATEALRALLEAMLIHSQSDKHAVFWSNFLARLQHDHGSPAHAAVSEHMLQSLIKTCIGLVALIKGRSGSDADVQLTAMILLALPATFRSAHGGAMWKARGKLSRHDAGTVVIQMFNHLVLATINGPAVAIEAQSETATGRPSVLPFERPGRKT